MRPVHREIVICRAYVCSAYGYYDLCIVHRDIVVCKCCA